MSIITAKEAQARAKAKAQKLVGMSNTAKPFYSDGENAGDKTGMRPISTRQFAKGGKIVGGKITGLAAAERADRVKRKAGGRIQDKFANVDQKEANKQRIGGKDHIGGYKKGGRIKKAGGGELPDAYEAMKSEGRLKGLRSNDDEIRTLMEKENSKISPDEYRKGNTAQGEYALKKGGKVKKAIMSSAAPAKQPAKAIAKTLPKAPKIEETPIKKMATAEMMKPKASAKPVDLSTEETAEGTNTPEEDEVDSSEGLKKGGRAKRKRGGRAKGSKINIIIAAGGQNPGDQAGMPMMAQPGAASPRIPMPPMGAGPQMPPGMAGGPGMAPPMGGPMPAMAAPPGGAPPMRKAGGRVNESYAKLKAGSGSGLGRLHKQGIRSI